MKLEKATAVYDGKSLSIHTDDGETAKYDTELDEYCSEIETFINHLKNGDEIKVAPLIEGVNSVRLVWKEVEAAGGAKI